MAHAGWRGEKSDNDRRDQQEQSGTDLKSRITLLTNRHDDKIPKTNTDYLWISTRLYDLSKMQVVLPSALLRSDDYYLLEKYHLNEQ
jgi:hypothetical protein